jgi:hypothetical protein
MPQTMCQNMPQTRVIPSMINYKPFTKDIPEIIFPVSPTYVSSHVPKTLQDMPQAYTITSRYNPQKNI